MKCYDPEKRSVQYNIVLNIRYESCRMSHICSVSIIQISDRCKNECVYADYLRHQSSPTETVLELVRVNSQCFALYTQIQRIVKSYSHKSNPYLKTCNWHMHLSNFLAA